MVPRPHVPTDIEWETLEAYLGGSVAGGDLKESGTSHWASPNTGATNSSGFSALPGGSFNGSSFMEIGSIGFWWSATAYNVSDAYRRGLGCNSGVLDSGSYDKPNGISVRLVRDN